MKKFLSMFIALTLIISSIVVFADETKSVSFTDVDANSASGAAIYKLVNSGILNGYGDGTFRPNNPLTRAELCKIINMVFNYTEAASDNFIDVKKDDWFYNYVAIAKKAGYITGHEDGTFRGNDFLTREEACAIIVRVGGLVDVTMTETITDKVSEWAVPYVNKVVGNKLMLLDANGKFRATERITRSELTSVASVFVKDTSVEEKPVEDEKTETDNKKDETTKNPETNTGSSGSSGGGGGGNLSGSTKYTVKFETNGGSSIKNASVKKNEQLDKPENPTRGGYVFENWYTDAELTKAYDFSSDVKKNFTLYAKWEIEDPEKQAEIVGKLESYVAKLPTIQFMDYKYIADEILEVMELVIADADNGINIYYGDYIIDNYADEIVIVKDDITELTEDQLAEFTGIMLTEFDEDEVNELFLTLFGITIDDAKDKITEE